MMNPNNVYREFQTAGEKWADLLGAAELAEVEAKGMRAKCFIDAKRSGVTVAEAEAMAACDPAVLNALREAATAKQQANRAKVGYEACKALFEAQRTAEATHRAAARAG